jgi:polyisoprenoid-binding protein YceI
MKHKYLLGLAAGLLLAAGSFAAPFQGVQLDKSSITFRYKQMGVAMDGKFGKFASTLNFDPAKPEQASATIDIDLASIDTGSGEGDDEVVGKPWFHAAAFPKAVFVLKQMKATAPNVYEASGTLSIKGRARELKFPVKYVAQGAKGQLSASFTLARADFAIGEGVWSKFDVIANDVQVNFQLTVQAGK